MKNGIYENYEKDDKDDCPTRNTLSKKKNVRLIKEIEVSCYIFF